MADIYAVGKYPTSFELGIRKLDDTWGNNGETERTVRWLYKLSTATTYKQTESTISNKIEDTDDVNENHWLTGLTPGTTYNIKADIYYNSNKTYLTSLSEVKATTYPSAPAVYTDDITANSATLTLQSIGKVSKYHVEVKQGGTTILNQTIYTTSTSKLVYSLTGLSANTTYTVWAYGILDLNGSDYYNTAYTASHSFTTLEAEDELWGDRDLGFTINLGNPYKVDITINPYTMYIGGFSPSKDGTVRIYTTGDVDTIGYLSRYWGYDKGTGVPTDSGAIYDDDSHITPNFLIEKDVIAGNEYYFYVRGYSKTASGVTTLHIDLSGGEWTLKFSATDMNITNFTSITASYNKNQIYVRKFHYTGNYRVTFSDGSGNLKNYLTEPDVELDSANGCPLNDNYLAYGDSSIGISEFTYNIEANKTYWLWTRSVDGSGTNDWSSIIRLNATLIPSVAKFEWKLNELNAFNNHGLTTTLTWTRWNELCDKVKEVIDSKNDTWDNYHASLADTKATESGNCITAKRFNSLRYNIDSKCTGVTGTGITNKKGKTIYSTRDGTQIGDVNNPDVVYGQYFIDIVTVLNNWIDSL